MNLYNIRTVRPPCHPERPWESKGLLGSHYLRFKVVLSNGILRRTHFVRLLRMTLRCLGCYLLIKCSLFINFFSGQVSKTTPVTLSDLGSRRVSKAVITFNSKWHYPGGSFDALTSFVCSG